MLNSFLLLCEQVLRGWLSVSPNYDEVIQWLVSFSFLFLYCLMIWCTFPDLSNKVDLFRLNVHEFFLTRERKIIFVAHFPSVSIFIHPRYSGWKGMFSEDLHNNPSIKGWSYHYIQIHTHTTSSFNKADWMLGADVYTCYNKYL